MRKILFAFAFVALAAPAAAQNTLPRGEDVEALAPVFDRATDAFLDVDVGPMIDAFDPYRRDRRPRHRTLRDLARDDDPYFDARLRRSIYGGAAAMGRTMDAIAAAEPQLRRSFRRFERDIEDAIDAARRPDFDDDWDRDFDDDEPWED